MNKCKPRWLREIPKPGPVIETREPTEEEKKEAQEFEEAVLSGKIDEWFNKK